MTDRTVRILTSYGTAVLASALAAAAHLAAPGILARILFLPMSLAAIAVTLAFGPGPGLVTAGLITLFIGWAVLPPPGFAVAAADDRAMLLVFFMLGVLLAVLASVLRRGWVHAVAREEALRERIKEQHCLYAIASTLRTSVADEAATLRAVAALIPGGWQRPESVAARISVEGVVVATEGYRQSEWRQAAPIEVDGARIGEVEVVLLDAPANGNPAFLPEEQNLLRAIAELLAEHRRRRQAEAERDENEEKLQRVRRLEAIGQLAGGVAHDFNNLLTGIHGFAQLALEGLPADSPVRADLLEVQRSADRAAGLTRQLLAFSRKQVLKARVIDLNETVRDTTRMLRRLIGEDVALVLRLEDGLGRVNADPGQIEQVIVNLALNARDAMPDGGEMVLETANTTIDEAEAADYPFEVRPGPYVLLAVRDNGTGMDAQTLERVFEPFFTTKEQGKGTGLGMSTVYGIVKQSGGYIWVDSSPGRGTVVRVVLPRVDGTAADHGSTEERGSVRGSETLLLVEDDGTVRTLARRVLERQGYHVLEARNGAEALRLAESADCRIDLVVSDVVMPELGGRQLVERLRRIRPDVPVLLMSGYTDDAVLRRGISEAGDLFLAKPFTTDALARKVRQALDGAGRG